MKQILQKLTAYQTLSHKEAENVMLSLGEANMSSALITQPGSEDFKYVVMPMRI